MRWLGIDIGGTSVKASLLDAQGVEICCARGARYVRPDRVGIVRAVGDVVREVVEGAGKEIAGVGLCMPGAVDPVTQRVTASANVPGLIGLDAREIVPEALGQTSGGVRVTQVTDAYASGGDYYRSKGLEGRLLAISLGTGVGAAVIDAGGVQLKLHGRSSGHFGQMDVSLSEDAPIGPDGGRGGLEAYIGLPALVKRYGCEQDPRKIFECMKAGEEPLRALARAIRIAHAIYKPQHVALLGGIGVGLGVAGHAEYLHGEISRGLTSVALPGWTLECATTDMHAARGAGLCAAGVIPGPG